MPGHTPPFRCAILCSPQRRWSSSKYTPRPDLGIKAKYYPNTTAPLSIPDVPIPEPDSLPGPSNLLPAKTSPARAWRPRLFGGPTKDALPAPDSELQRLDGAVESGNELAPAWEQAKTRWQRTRALREPLEAAHLRQRQGGAPLVPLPHQGFVPSYLMEKQRWQRAMTTSSYWICLVILCYGFLFYDFGTNRPDAMTPLRAWFAPKWERFWTLTPYDRLVLGLSLDDAAERLELQTLKELAYRPPLESDVFWQRSNYVESGMDVPTVGAYGDGRIIDQTWTMPRKPS